MGSKPIEDLISHLSISASPPLNNWLDCSSASLFWSSSSLRSFLREALWSFLKHSLNIDEHSVSSRLCLPLVSRLHSCDLVVGEWPRRWFRGCEGFKHLFNSGSKAIIYGIWGHHWRRRRRRFFEVFARCVLCFLVKCFGFKKKKKLNGFRVGYGYPWTIYPDKIRVWILMGIDIPYMSKLFR